MQKEDSTQIPPPMNKKLLCLIWFLTGSLMASLPGKDIPLGKTGKVDVELGTGWTIEPPVGSDKFGVSYTFGCKAPQNKKATWFATLVAFSESAGKVPDEVFLSIVQSGIEPVLEKSVEKVPELQKLSINGGNGFYCIFTDAELVGKEVSSTEFKVLGLFFARYDSGELMIATALTDDANGKDFQKMKGMIESIRPSLVVPKSDEVKTQKGKKGISVISKKQKMSIILPIKGLTPEKMDIGGGTSRPNYFFLKDNSGLVISGWIEPIEKFYYNNAKELWNEDMKSPNWRMGQAPQNQMFASMNGWDTFSYDMKLPGEGMNNSHLRANLLRGKSWVDLHFSITDKANTAKLQERMMEILRTIKIEDL